MKAARATSDGGVLDAQRPVAADPPREKLRPGEPATLMRRTRGRIRRELWPVGAFSLPSTFWPSSAPLHDAALRPRAVQRLARDPALLTLIAVAALAVFGLLSGVRRSSWSGSATGSSASSGRPRSTPRWPQAPGQGRASVGPPSRALADIKAFFASEGVVAFLDAPWTPVFLLVIALLHPAARPVRAGRRHSSCCACALANEALTREPARGRGAGGAAGAAHGRGGRGPGRARGRAGHAHRPPAPLARSAGRAGGALALARERSRRASLSLAQFLRSALQLGILGLGAWLVLDRSLTSGGMIAASILLARALAPIDRALPAWKTVRRRARRRTGRSRTCSAGRRPRPPRQRLPRPQGRLVVEDLTYVPPGAEAPLLHDIQLRPRRPARSLGIVGPSGAGKSTLAISWSAPGRRSAAPSASTTPPSSNGTTTSSAAISATCRNTRACSPARCAENIARHGPARPRRRWSPPPSSPARTR